MKKIFIILLCMITLNANATEMCARNDTVVIPLDATINGTAAGSYSKVEWLWWTQYEYGTLYGDNACLSKKEIMMYSDWNGDERNLPAVLNTTSGELIGNQGYYMNADTNPDIPDSEKSDYERKFCFIQLTHPMLSVWVFANNYGLAGTCKNLCTQNIGGSFPSTQMTTRQAFFNSIGTVPPWTE